MTETATFAAGCFWGVEAAFRRIEGVQRTQVGYTGGAEAVQVEFDPERVSYDELLDAFWAEHDPTQVNRQGWDFGDQYRTEIFVHSPEQEAAAIASRDREQSRRRKPIATKITPAETFWPAEEYHQRYLEKRGLSSCAIAVDN